MNFSGRDEAHYDNFHGAKEARRWICLRRTCCANLAYNEAIYVCKVDMFYLYKIETLALTGWRLPGMACWWLPGEIYSLRYIVSVNCDDLET